MARSGNTSGKGKRIRANYTGRCARTGQQYGPGTLIERAPDGKRWQIVEGETPAHVPVQKWMRFSPLPPSTETTQRLVDISLPIFCGCSRERPDFDEKDPATHYRFHPNPDDENKYHCEACGRTAEIFEPEPERRTCWECGCKFTYAECKRNGGDWNENGGYCGC